MDPCNPCFCIYHVNHDKLKNIGFCLFSDSATSLLLFLVVLTQFQLSNPCGLCKLIKYYIRFYILKMRKIPHNQNFQDYYQRHFNNKSDRPHLSDHLDDTLLISHDLLLQKLLYCRSRVLAQIPLIHEIFPILKASIIVT